MKLIHLILAYMLFMSCSAKPEQRISQLTEDNTPTSTVEIFKDLEEKRYYTMPYPEKAWGLWGNLDYLKKLKETNSIVQANALMDEFFVAPEIKIEERNILSDNYYKMQYRSFDTRKYNLLEGPTDSLLYVEDPITEEMTLYTLIQKYEKGVRISSLYDNKYSALHNMRWEWFQGEYEFIDVANNSSKTLTFTKDGYIEGLREKPLEYLLDAMYFDPTSEYKTGSEETLFIQYLSTNDFVMEYRDDIFYLYETEDYDNLGEPLIKSHLAYQLIKKNENH